MNDTQNRSTPPQPEAHPAPVQPLLESDARNWAMMVHFIAIVAMFLSGGFLGFVAPLVIWLMHRQRSALVDFHGRQNLNLQISLVVSGILAIVLGIATLGVGLLLTLPLWGVYWIYALVISIVAGVKAQGGEYYKIRFIIPFIR